MTQTNHQRPTDDDMKQSFAWGQLFAGSLIGGLAVWKLLHKMTNTEPSEWFAGLSRAYEEVRDFLMTPFQWIQLDLTTDEKNVIALTLVLAAGVMRAFIAVRQGLFRYAALGLLIAAMTVAWFSQLPSLILNIRGMIFVVAWCAFVLSIVLPSVRLLQSERYDEGENRLSRLVLANVIFTALCGTILLLLNWATS